MSTKTFNLTWPEHLKNLSLLFHKLYANNKLVDVTLVCVEGSIKAHKIVLSICSPFFQKIIEDNPCEHPVLILRGTSLQDVEHIIDFMYTGKIRISENDLNSLVQTADDLEIKGLRECIEESCNVTLPKKNKENNSKKVYQDSKENIKNEENDWDSNNVDGNETTTHGRDTRFKGKKRVNVSFDERIPKTTKIMATPKPPPPQPEPFKVIIKGNNKNIKTRSFFDYFLCLDITGADGKVIQYNKPEENDDEETSNDKNEKAQQKSYINTMLSTEGYYMDDAAIPDVQLHEGEEEYQTMEESDEQVMKNTIILFQLILFMFQDRDSQLLEPIESRSFQCNICRKLFRSANDLHCHIRVHTEKKPFKCDYCETW